jgi:hypothetical protein
MGAMFEEYAGRRFNNLQNILTWIESTESGKAIPLYSPAGYGEAKLIGNFAYVGGVVRPIGPVYLQNLPTMRSGVIASVTSTTELEMEAGHSVEAGETFRVWDTSAGAELADRTIVSVNGTTVVLSEAVAGMAALDQLWCTNDMGCLSVGDSTRDIQVTADIIAEITNGEGLVLTARQGSSGGAMVRVVSGDGIENSIAPSSWVGVSASLDGASDTDLDGVFAGLCTDDEARNVLAGPCWKNAQWQASVAMGSLTAGTVSTASGSVPCSDLEVADVCYMTTNLAAATGTKVRYYGFCYDRDAPTWEGYYLFEETPSVALPEIKGFAMRVRCESAGTLNAIEAAFSSCEFVAGT